MIFVKFSHLWGTGSGQGFICLTCDLQETAREGSCSARHDMTAQLLLLQPIRGQILHLLTRYLSVCCPVCLTGCNVTIHNRCRDSLASCAKMKQRVTSVCLFVYGSVHLSVYQLPVCLIFCLPLPATETGVGEKQLSSTECCLTYQEWVCLPVYLPLQKPVCLFNLPVYRFTLLPPCQSVCLQLHLCFCHLLSSDDEGASELSHLPFRLSASVSAGVQTGPVRPVPR